MNRYVICDPVRFPVCFLVCYPVRISSAALMIDRAFFEDDGVCPVIKLFVFIVLEFAVSKSNGAVRTGCNEFFIVFKYSGIIVMDLAVLKYNAVTI